MVYNFNNSKFKGSWSKKSLMIDFVALILFVLPVYVANGIPVVLGGGARLDMNRKFIDGKPIFGSGKTIRGFVAGVLGGAVAAGLITALFPLSFFVYSGYQFLGGLMMALGAMVGDTAGSFFKRRLGIESGKQFFPDTMVFLAFALLFVLPYVNSSLYSIENMVFLFGLTIILHPASNFVANKIGLKRVPW
jgi:CDP-2,3-bis-(O-geranylgeranyl)-sn-glycerol synthase